MVTIEEEIGNTMIITLNGKVSHSDYVDTMVPALERMLEKHPSVNICAHCGDDFDGYALHAMLDDAKIGIKHWSAWGRIAISNAPSWLEKMIKVATMVMMRGRVKCFKDKTSALNWVVEG
jgi:hypothetical protein